MAKYPTFGMKFFGPLGRFDGFFAASSWGLGNLVANFSATADDILLCQNSEKTFAPIIPIYRCGVTIHMFL